MKKFLPRSLFLIVGLILSQQAMALTFKTGEVIGSDGKVYEGMSPQNKENMLANVKPGEIKSGIHGKSFYVVVNNIVTTVPLVDLMKKTTVERMEIVGKAITENITLSNALSSPAVNISDSPTSPSIDENSLNVNQLAGEGASPLGQLQSDEFEESFDSALDEVGKEVDLSVLPSIGGDLGNALGSVFADSLGESLGSVLAEDLEKHLNYNLGGGAMGSDGAAARP